MFSLSAQSFQLGYAPSAVPAVESVAPANRAAMLDASAIAGERNFQRGGVNGRLDEVQVGKLTSFQGGHRQELAVDSFSTVDSLGLAQKFDLGNGSGGSLGGYSRENKKMNQAALSAKNDNAMSGQLAVLSGHIILVMWQSVELLLAPLWKLLQALINKLFGEQVQPTLLTGFEQAGQNPDVFALKPRRAVQGNIEQPFKIFNAS